MTYFNQFKNATRKTKRLLVLFALLFGFSANAATYKVSDNPADLANLPEGAKVVMYNIGAKRLVGYNNGEVSKTEKAVTDADQAAYVFIVKKSGSTVALVNSTSYGPRASYNILDFSFKWSTSPTYFVVNSESNYTQLYYKTTTWLGSTVTGYLAFENSKMTVTSSSTPETSRWNFYEVTQETSGSTGDGAATVHNQLKAWQTNAGYQEVGYIGLGNKNQVLAMACVSVSADDVPTLTYRLFGHTDYLSAISVYARMRDKGQDYFPDGSYAKYENTFAHIFDYRNPEKNCGALFLGTTHEVPAAGEVTTFTSNLKLPAGEYVIYLVANVRSAEEIGGLKNLPLIGGAKANYTRVGGVIDKVSNKTINTVNNYSGEGGGRVLVPKFKLLYAPRYEKFATSEEYSRYYRIPAITRASDGTLVALSDARKMHIHDVTNSIDVVSRRSSDNGKTWSDYVVIFQGSQSGTNCYNWAGYGDAAVASFANGTVVATAIHGFGLAGSSTDPATDVVWKVSRDNGKSWSSEYTMDRKLFGGLRGNISPGNICVANEGHLKGKALVGLRTSTSPNNGYTNTSAKYQRIYCLTYDPDENEWTRVKISSKDYLENTSNYLDEVQFVQVAENQYILSARSNASGNRLFYRLAFTSATEATATMISQSGMNLANPCNGDLIKYAAKGGTYILHTVPKDMVYSVAALADNHNDEDGKGLVIYAVYNVEAGFSTRVNTQYNNGLNSSGIYESQYSYWTPSTDTQHVERIQGAKGGTQQDKDLVIPVAANQNNTHIGGTGNAADGGLTYPQALNYGLDAYVTLVPDSRAAKYLNAIIRVKKDDAYLQNYYVVNGANQALHGNITSAFNGCLGVVNWYAYSDGEFYPMAVGMKTYEVGSKPKATSARRSIVEGGANGAWYKVESDISFAGICEKAETFDGVVTVEIYLVNGDVTSVNELSNSNYYITKVSHTIVKDPDISTGVEDVDAEKTVAGVTYYNLLGVSSDSPFEGVNVVVTTYTDGTKSSKKILK